MLNDEIQFRRANPHELVQVAELRWQLQTAESQNFNRQLRAQFVADFVESRVVKDEFVHWVVVIRDRVIATMAVRKIIKLPAPDSAPNAWGYLTNCYTLPDYRNQNVGAQLLAEIQRWAVQENLEVLVVWPSERSYAFYLRSGFKRYPDPLVLKLASED